jgi:acetyl esterase/lipase
VSHRVAAIDVDPADVGAGLAIGARIWSPPAGVPAVGALVDLHGGMWANGDRTTDAGLDSQLAGHGIVTIALDVPPASSATCIDIMEALRRGCAWALRVVRQLTSVERTGLLGCSSGGHLALLIGMSPPVDECPGPVFDYLVACWPVVDPAARLLYAKRVGRADIVAATGHFFGTVEMLDLLNPQVMLERGEHGLLPPLLLAIAGSDTNIPEELHSRFARDYRGRGGIVTVSRFPDAAHSFAIDAPGSPDALRLVEDIRNYAVEPAG